MSKSTLESNNQSPASAFPLAMKWRALAALLRSEMTHSSLYSRFPLNLAVSICLYPLFACPLAAQQRPKRLRRYSHLTSEVNIYPAP